MVKSLASERKMPDIPYIPLTVIQIAEILLVTVAFGLHLITFYDLSIRHFGNMVMFEATIYTIFVVITIAELIATFTAGNYLTTVKPIAKVLGAVLFSVLGIMTFQAYLYIIVNSCRKDSKALLGLVKGVVSMLLAAIYFVNSFIYINLIHKSV